MRTIAQGHFGRGPLNLKRVPKETEGETEDAEIHCIGQM